MINNSRGKYKALVIHNEGANFSAGANLGFAKMMMQARQMGIVEDMVYYGQSVYNALRYAPFPVVGAPKGLALGGGCEVLLHCDAIQADAETYMGLVEVGVGIIPGWNGCARTLERMRESEKTPGGPMPAARLAFQQVMLPQFSMSTSGQDARKKLWMRKTDGVTMNSDRLLADAKTKALSLVDGYTPPEPSVFNLPGKAGKASIASAIEEMAAQNMVTKHDARVAEALADTLTGGDVANHTTQLTEDDLAYLERRNFYALLRTPETKARISHMIAKGKPLREKEMATTETMREIRRTTKAFNTSSKPLKREPLKGWDAFKLRSMAGITWTMYKVLGLKKK
jgi:3-hydroxyacyl-CoA dehydrogenase